MLSMKWLNLVPFGCALLASHPELVEGSMSPMYFLFELIVACDSIRFSIAGGTYAMGSSLN
jgi:hypothetical protein